MAMYQENESFENSIYIGMKPRHQTQKKIVFNSLTKNEISNSVGNLKMKPCSLSIKTEQTTKQQIFQNKKLATVQYCNSETQTTDIGLDTRSAIGSGRDQSKLKSRSQSRQGKKDLSLNKQPSIYNKLRHNLEFKRRMENTINKQRIEDQNNYEKNKFILKFLINNGSALLLQSLQDRNKLFNNQNQKLQVKQKRTYKLSMPNIINKRKSVTIAHNQELICKKLRLSEINKLNGSSQIYQRSRNNSLA